MTRNESPPSNGRNRATGGALVGALTLLGVLAVLAGPFSEPAGGENGIRPAAPPVAHDFALKDINPNSPHYGRTLRLSDLYRGKGVVLNFMASWCQPCQVELPVLESIHGSGEAKVVCIAADEYGGPEGLVPMIEQLGITMPVLFAPENLAITLARNYTYQIIPATYMIDEAGRVRSAHEGLMTKKSLIEAIRRDLD